MLALPRYILPKHHVPTEAQATISTIYQLIEIFEGERQTTIETILNDKGIPWHKDLRLEERLRLFLELQGAGLPVTVLDGKAYLSDPWGKPLNLAFSSWTGASENPAEQPEPLTARLRIWSSGPNGEDEGGQGDDVLPFAK